MRMLGIMVRSFCQLLFTFGCSYLAWVGGWATSDWSTRWHGLKRHRRVECLRLLRLFCFRFWGPDPWLFVSIHKFLRLDRWLLNHPIGHNL